jgi:hypothetical protein
MARIFKNIRNSRINSESLVIEVSGSSSIRDAEITQAIKELTQVITIANDLRAKQLLSEFAILMSDKNASYSARKKLWDDLLSALPLLNDFTELVERVSRLLT